MNAFSRRSLLKTGAAFAATLASPSLVRAAPKEIVIGGPAGAAKYFNADLFPALEKKLDCKVLYEGTNSLTNLQKMQADKASPKISVVIMDDPVMLPAAAEGLITKMSSSSIPNLGKLVGDAVHQDGMWANYQKPWAGIAYSTKRVKTPPVSWAELWDAKYDSKIVVPSLSNTEGFWTLLAAAHLETGKPYKEAQYDIDAGFKKIKSLKANLLNVYTNAPQAINLLEQGEAWMIGGQFSAYTLIRKADGSPVDLAIPKDGGFSMPSGIAKVTGAPAGDLADAVIDFYLSPEAQSILAKTAFIAPTNQATPLPAGYPDPASLFAPDWAFIAKNRAGWVDRWSKEMT
ncbi:extracellular solute-binding protein [Bradyrhizobium sp. 83012]|uniref:Extracellular solute-binding protein n=1 Tax=Bradyrhizobium aeschynomenes TaxID=2734909 RepID=A0ABX2CKF4_9BRAD|nr:extracellular solute-binding protein [Bradyrhizobium aeschynomenes]NPU14282.1 extracellular solute-binding protein [Bradyrhizobium aeschynomenes]NPU67777.1 extracellular solute-binding protein [Bradyrhizobium aeschynomenes]NPV23939.1 extracellular solute-binding protein [Bradyrhizobium aeschynomenes]